MWNLKDASEPAPQPLGRADYCWAVSTGALWPPSDPQPVIPPAPTAEVWCRHLWIASGLLYVLLDCLVFLQNMNSLPTSVSWDVSPKHARFLVSLEYLEGPWPLPCLISHMIPSAPTPSSLWAWADVRLPWCRVCPGMTPQRPSPTHVCHSCTCEGDEVKSKLLSCVWLFATPWTIQSTEFSRPEYSSG